jgi:hypothetical protein
MFDVTARTNDMVGPKTCSTTRAYLVVGHWRRQDDSVVLGDHAEVSLLARIGRHQARRFKAPTLSTTSPVWASNCNMFTKKSSPAFPPEGWGPID